MMKISVQENSSVTTLKIEGRIVGPWAIELGEVWRKLWGPSEQKSLRLDIRDVGFVDRTGSQVLEEIVSEAGAEILGDSPLTQQFAKKARCNRAAGPIEEN